jgi:hypothetical protein
LRKYPSLQTWHTTGELLQVWQFAGHGMHV